MNEIEINVPPSLFFPGYWIWIIFFFKVHSSSKMNAHHPLPVLHNNTEARAVTYTEARAAPSGTASQSCRLSVRREVVFWGLGHNRGAIKTPFSFPSSSVFFCVCTCTTPTTRRSRWRGKRKEVPVQKADFRVGNGEDLRHLSTFAKQGFFRHER